jgi:hypothetical protein
MYDLDGRWGCWKFCDGAKAAGRGVGRGAKWVGGKIYSPTRFGLFAKGNEHLVMRDGRPGLHWGGHQHRIEWGKGKWGWHYNDPSGGHHSVGRGLWEAGKRLGGRVARGLGRAGGGFFPSPCATTPHICNRNQTSYA